MARDYRKEYEKFQSSKTEKKHRAQRNKARREAVKAGLARKGDGMEVDHKTPLAKGGSNGPKNRRVVSRATNRRKGKQ